MVTAVATGGAHATHGAGVVVVDSTLTGLGVSHRNAGSGGELTQLLGSFGVDGATTGDDQRALGGADLGDGAL